MVVSRHGGRRLLLCRSRGVSPLFELKVELLQTPYSTVNTVYQCSSDIPMFYSNVAKINSARVIRSVFQSLKIPNVAYHIVATIV